MSSARILACAAALGAVALPSAAFAQGCWAIGSPQPTPPCLTADVGKALQQAKDIQEKAQQLQTKKNEILQYASIEKVMGAVGPRKIPSFPSIPAIAPLAQKSFVQAGAEARSKVATTSLDTTATNEHKRLLALDLRAAAGDGYAIAMATKTRFDGMNRDAQSITTLSTKCSVDERSDWSFNTMARSLMLRAMAARKEIDAAQVQLVSAKVMASPRMAVAISAPVAPQAQSAPESPQVVGPAWSLDLKKISDLTSYLAALITAKDMLADFRSSIKDHQQTQQEYQTVLRAANQAQANMVSFANSEGRKKGVSGANLLANADRIMASMDHTTWDDPSKTSVANQAAKRAKTQLDGMVKGDVSSSWVSNLANRAEALKQEAFYRQLDQTAKGLQTETLATIATYGKSINVNMDQPGALDAAIAATQNSLGIVGKQMDAAPDVVKQQRDAIYKSTMLTAGFPDTAPTS